MKNALPFLTLLATAAFVASPFLTDPFSGFDPARFPVPQVDPPVQPAGYAFAIWGLIYVWLGVLAIVAVTLRRNSAAWQPIHLPLTLSLGPGALWLWVAGINPPAATALIFWMLGTAIWALLSAPRTDRWLLQAPIALYAGWLTAAAHVSLGVQIAGYGLAAPATAAVIALIIAVLIAQGVARARPQAPEYAAAVIWALVAVIIANLGGDVLVLAVAALGALAMAGIAVYGLKSEQARATL